VLLGALTSVLSVVALTRALTSMSRTARLDRTREMLHEELARLARVDPSEQARQEQTTSYVGVRGGWLDGANAQPAAPLPAEWRTPLAHALEQSAQTHARATLETEQGAATLVIAVEPAAAGRFAWTGYLVQPSSFMRPWRWITGALAVATALLIATTVLGMASFRRSSAALHATLVALGKDLATPVPTPGIAELTGIADGIRGLAAELQKSRADAERLSRELAQKDRLAALGRVAAGIAHEVRNPLASIKLRLDLAAAAHALPEATRKALDAASQEIARLDRLVGDLLLVAGKKLGERREVELAELVRARVEALQPWAASHEVQVAVRADGDGRAAVDPESVARALDNLLRNAVEASPRGATVEARVIPNGRAVEVRVEDHGRGVEPARAAELFEPFFTTKADGTGLGLAISRAIARAHGGDLTYARAGEVTAFALSLPKQAERAA
jgi:signal transduction histidine kinase